MKQKRHIGDILRIPLGDGRFTYGLVLPEPRIAVYDALHTEESDLTLNQIIKQKILFDIWVMNYAIEDRIWLVVGSTKVDDHLIPSPWYSKVDSISGAISKYRQGVEQPVTIEEAATLEPAVAWFPEHVQDRLRDHYDGLPNKWLEVFRRSRGIT